MNEKVLTIMSCIITAFILLSCSYGRSSGQAYGAYPEQVLLKDVQVLTLRQGHMTSGRRSSPVPQLKCVGGTAGCTRFVPQVIQCYNRGSDGNDIQWECKTDMDNAYRFGRTDVTCEGFNYPDDPYILKGSCGVEYTIDLTKEGYEKANTGGGYYGHQSGSSHESGSHYASKEGTGLGGLIPLLLIAALFYVVYKYLLAPSTTHPPTGSGPTAPPPYAPPPPYSQGGYPGTGNDNSPPPPGFKPQYTAPPSAGFATGGPSASQYNAGTSTHTGGSSSAGASSGLGGFWTGAATGGTLGYLFGSRNNQQAYPRQPWGSSGGGWGGGGWGSSGGMWGGTGGGGSSWSSGSGASGSSSSTGTRTASGFGGTNRR